MSNPPANVQEATAQIIASGIAHRMLVGSYQSHLPNDPSGCLFWAEVETEAHEKESVAVIVQFPPHGHTQRFLAMPGKSFGIFGQSPLSAEQQALVDRLARA